MRGLFGCVVGLGNWVFQELCCLRFSKVSEYKLLGLEIFGCILVVTCKESGVKQSILKALLVLSGGIGLSKR